MDSAEVRKRLESFTADLVPKMEELHAALVEHGLRLEIAVVFLGPSPESSLVCMEDEINDGHQRVIDAVNYLKSQKMIHMDSDQASFKRSTRGMGQG